MKINLPKTRKEVFNLVKKTNNNVLYAIRNLSEYEQKKITAYVMFTLWIEISSFYDCYNLLLS